MNLIVTDPNIMSGVPVFAGSRLPIDTAIAILDDGGTPFAELQTMYPFLTEEHIQAARTYMAEHPPRGRPKRFIETNPHWRVVSSRIIQGTHPNATTQEAMAELAAGRGKRFADVDSFMADLRSDDED